MAEHGGRSGPADSTGSLTVGRYVMRVGAPEGTIVQRVRLRGAPPRDLADALAGDEGPPGADVEKAIENADEVAKKIDHAATLFTKLATGQIDAGTVLEELDRLFKLLIGLDRAGRHEETLRLARVLTRLLAVTLRFAALVETLRVALGAAKALADSKAVAWVLHELGTLALGADDAQAAERDLGEARRLRREVRDLDGLAATEHNLEYVGGGGVFASRALRLGAGGLVLALVLALVVVAVAGEEDDDDPRPTPTATQSATATPTEDGDDATAPTVTLATDELTNARTPTLAGTAGTEEGDSPQVTVRVYDGTDAAGDPLQERQTERGDDGRFTVAAEALPSGSYTAQAVQSDEAGNRGESDPVTFTVDLDSPVVAITAPTDGVSGTGPSPDVSGTAGQADGDLPTVSLSGGTSSAEAAVQPDGTWKATAYAVPVVGDPVEPVTVTAEQRDEAGNVGSAGVTFTPTDPVQ